MIGQPKAKSSIRYTMIFARFTAGILIASLTLHALACARHSTTSVVPVNQRSTTPPYGEAASKPSQETFNLEALESDPARISATTIESRNLRLSQLWFERSEQLASIPGPSFLSALLRSSHFAIESLLSEPCANPFNETCRDLHRFYLKALDKLVREIARNGWELPELAPSRYRFSGTDAEKLRNLRDWRFNMDTLPSRNDSDRAGLGLPTVGCRQRWGDSETRELTGVSICSPITFILTFEHSTSEERLTAHLAAVNAYEQEVFETSGIAVPIASATSAALEIILSGADSANGAKRLWCLTKPERTRTMALGIVSAPAMAINLLDSFGSIARDSELQGSYTPCVFVTNGGGSIAQATTLLRLSRALVAPRIHSALEREPIRMFPIVSGNDAVSMTRALLARIKRQAHRASKIPGQPTTFSLSAISVNIAYADTAAINDIDRYANDLNAPVARAPDQAELLRDLPALARAYREQNAPSGPTTLGADSTPPEPNELSLSPVM
jgi:hypothetical protein